MNIADWGKLYKQFKLKDIQPIDFSEEVPDLRKHFEEQLGTVGLLKMVLFLAIDESFHNTLIEYDSMIKEGKDYIGCGYIIGRKKG